MKVTQNMILAVITILKYESCCMKHEHHSILRRDGGQLLTKKLDIRAERKEEQENVNKENTLGEIN